MQVIIDGAVGIFLNREENIPFVGCIDCTVTQKILMSSKRQSRTKRQDQSAHWCMCSISFSDAHEVCTCFQISIFKFLPATAVIKRASNK